MGRGPTQRAWLLALKHLHDNNETYISHLLFAGSIGLALLFRGLLFIGHGVLPICCIPKKYNLEGTLEKLRIWNAYANKRTLKVPKQR
jgi:hypothetical protein